MKPFQTSSGDLNADRRADYAEMLHADGDHAQAAELLLGALELVPQWTAGWFRLGEFQESAGALELAAQAWTMALKLEPADRLGAALKLQLIGKAPPTSGPPGAFVEALFDHYADSFDESLVDKLGYRVPELLERAIRTARPGRFALVLDLGCGTGLMGQRLRPIADRLEGYDISAGMLRRARAKGIYDEVAKADLRDFARAGPKADLVTVTDVFIYIGALGGAVNRIAGLLVDDGLFAFSVEKLDGDGDFVLQPSRRYAHSERYVREVLAANGFLVLSLETTVIRQDRREPVSGLVILAVRSPHA
ncbi:class I SAM-dependent DNA methyltransferase [Mesorhizobium sp. ES1-1]|uniref:class I SAM-dependent DNA methyltransferase n=1 Tax=Mesorhizobium sp. ES1-1 TaxID=2876629 RepID=UPI001CCAD712|nr:methyltransferase domain-containing protein [Mesorhizobium sp. ES1-1]MBZ9678115.1 methyltransferase domain-containing protein [Mesorhizobium sp. ES1-1]